MDDESAKKLSDQLKEIEKEDASSKAINLIKFRKGEKVEPVKVLSDEDDPLIDEPVVFAEKERPTKFSVFPTKNKWVNLIFWSFFILFDVVCGFIIYIYLL